MDKVRQKIICDEDKELRPARVIAKLSESGATKNNGKW